MTTNEKIAKIRELMKRDQIQALIIPSGDPHMSTGEPAPISPDSPVKLELG